MAHLAPRVLDNGVAADIRLQREYGLHKRRLARLAGRRYGLPADDCEELADDTLVAWHRQLRTREGVRSDRLFFETVLRARAIDRLRAKSVQAVEISDADSVGTDPQHDVLVAEREESQQPRELQILFLAEYGLSRAELANRFDLSLRQVKRRVAHARRKLEAAHARMHGREAA
jgi:DNA-directed RNA polymerase specialized sigma24 family protein